MPGFPEMSQAEHVALPEVSMEPKLSFCSCSVWLWLETEWWENPSTLVCSFLTPRYTKGCMHQPISTPSSSLCFPAAPVILLSQDLAAQSPSRGSIHHRDFGRHVLVPVLPRMQGLAVVKTWAAELSGHCSVGGSSVQQLWPCSRSPPCLASGKSSRSRFGVQRGAGSHGRGRAGWSCNHGHVRE